MHVQDISRQFNFTYEKTADEVRSKAKDKLITIKAKIEERRARIRDIRAQYGITDAVLNDILLQFNAAQRTGAMVQNYSSNVRSSGSNSQGETVTVGAGTINFLFAEQEHIDGEHEQVERLELMVRNINDVTRYTSNGSTYVEKFKLSYEELKFLGF